MRAIQKLLGWGLPLAGRVGPEARLFARHKAAAGLLRVRAQPPNLRKSQSARNVKASSWPPSSRHQRRAQRKPYQRQRLWLRYRGGHIAGAHSHGMQRTALADAVLEAADVEDPRAGRRRPVLRTGPVAEGLHINELGLQPSQIATHFRPQIQLTVRSTPPPSPACDVGLLCFPHLLGCPD